MRQQLYKARRGTLFKPKREGSLGSIAVFNKFYCHSLSSQARLAVNKHQTTTSDGQGFDKLLGTGPNIIKPLSVLSVLVAVEMQYR